MKAHFNRIYDLIKLLKLIATNELNESVSLGENGKNWFSQSLSDLINNLSAINSMEFIFDSTFYRDTFKDNYTCAVIKIPYERQVRTTVDYMHEK